MAHSTRFRSWLRREETVVVLVAIALAIPAAYLVRFSLDVAFEGSFLALVAVGVGVPTAYERWPQRHGRLRASAWTLVVSVAVVATFVLAYTVINGPLGEFAASVGAFLLAELGLFAVTSLADGR